MRHREFDDLLVQTFGEVYAPSVLHDLVLTALSGRTATQALAEGEEPKVVWLALCDAMDVPEERRWLDDTRSR